MPSTEPCGPRRSTFDHCSKIPEGSRKLAGLTQTKAPRQQRPYPKKPKAPPQQRPTNPKLVGLALLRRPFLSPFHHITNAFGSRLLSLITASMSATPFREPGRRSPAKGVHVSLAGPNWVFLTVCTQKRERWLATLSVQRALHEIWQHTATAWLVSDYLLMPDHLHLFCAAARPQIHHRAVDGVLEGSLCENTP